MPRGGDWGQAPFWLRLPTGRISPGAEINEFFADLQPSYILLHSPQIWCLQRCLPLGGAKKAACRFAPGCFGTSAKQLDCLISARIVSDDHRVALPLCEPMRPMS
jgi:hypothetical protein